MLLWPQTLQFTPHVLSFLHIRFQAGPEVVTHDWSDVDRVPSIVVRKVGTRFNVILSSTWDRQCVWKFWKKSNIAMPDPNDKNVRFVGGIWIV